MHQAAKSMPYALQQQKVPSSQAIDHKESLRCIVRALFSHLVATRPHYNHILCLFFVYYRMQDMKEAAANAE
jgi:hypothetical protein